MSFKLSEFTASPSQELLDLAKKSDLLDIVDHYGLPNVKKTILNMKLRIFSFSPRFSGENKGQISLSQPICNYCKQSGRIISERIALKRKRKKEKQESPKPTGLTSLRLKPQSSIQDKNPISAKTSETDAVMEIYEPYLSDGSVSLNSDSAQSTPLKSCENLVLLNPLSRLIPCLFLRRLLLGQVSLSRV